MFDVRDLNPGDALDVSSGTGIHRLILVDMSDDGRTAALASPHDPLNPVWSDVHEHGTAQIADVYPGEGMDSLMKYIESDTSIPGSGTPGLSAILSGGIAIPIPIGAAGGTIPRFDS